MLKRIPKFKNILGDRSAWTLKEISHINHKCMKLAETEKPSNFSLIIRAPVPWHQQYLISREFASHNLFAAHPVSLEIRRLWSLKYILKIISF